MKKYNLIVWLAAIFSKVLPERKPALHKMKDHDFITILSWLEGWEPEKVYKTAYRQSHLDTYYSWDEWAEDMKPLPIPVRAEMERALKIHEEAGNLAALRTYAFLYEVLVEKWFPRIMWVIFILLILLTLAN